jgi:hypothetical protein
VQDSQASDRCHYWAKLVLIWHTNGTLQFSNQTNRAISIAVDVHWGLAGRWSRVFVGKRYQPEQGRNLLRQIKVVWRTAGSSTSVQGTRYRGADVLPLAQGGWRPTGGPGATAEGAGAGEREIKAVVAELSLDKLALGHRVGEPLSPEQRSSAVSHACERGVSERHGCLLLG